uniref:Uncharacterized protein n=1 Tax=Arundo donax TaxID=35708 RepID=A0A0A9CKS2_ARUDO
MEREISHAAYPEPKQVKEIKIFPKTI